jgi:hypothetical protein
MRAKRRHVCGIAPHCAVETFAQTQNHTTINKNTMNENNNNSAAAIGAFPY